MAKNYQTIFVYALFWPFGTPKGPQVGTIYVLISKLNQIISLIVIQKKVQNNQKTEFYAVF
jgi:hypothetical protein